MSTLGYEILPNMDLNWNGESRCNQVLYGTNNNISEENKNQLTYNGSASREMYSCSQGQLQTQYQHPGTQDFNVEPVTGMYGYENYQPNPINNLGGSQGFKEMGLHSSQMMPYWPQSEYSMDIPCGKRKRKRIITTEQRRAANVRERKRMFQLNEAFDKLRKRVPTFAYEKKLSRIETLRLAVTYIEFMAEVVENNGEKAKKSDSVKIETRDKHSSEPLQSTDEDDDNDDDVMASLLTSP